MAVLVCAGRRGAALCRAMGVIPKAEALDRTTKLEMDEGRASTFEEASAIVGGYRLAVDVGPGLEDSVTRQAILATVLNTAPRAFKGGVFVRTDDDADFRLPWWAGRRLSEIVTECGAQLVDELPDVVTIAVGNAQIGPNVIRATWQGWAGGVVVGGTDRLAESSENVVAGVLAGGIAVSECFQRIRGSVRAGRRSVGLSLWRPDLLWTLPEGSGPILRDLPSRYWLAGLGHLGQAYAWIIGCLPYADPATVDLILQDVDVVEAANAATGMIVTQGTLGQRKTRVVANALEGLGFRTAVVERLFDGDTRRRLAWPVEPGILLTGFDNGSSRRLLENRGFELIVDGGLGAGPREYLAIRVHRFPSQLRAYEIFAEGPARLVPDPLAPPAYRAEIDRLVSMGQSDLEAGCGLLAAAGTTVAAAFVGAVAGPIVLSDVIREIHGGPRFALVDVDLASPNDAQVLPDTSSTGPLNPGFAPARP
jgi:hypothetical protein